MTSRRGKKRSSGQGSEGVGAAKTLQPYVARSPAASHSDKKQGRYEIGSSKWQEQKDEAEAHELTAVGRELIAAALGLTAVAPGPVLGVHQMSLST